MRRNKRFNMVMTDREMKQIENIAKANGLSCSEVVRIAMKNLAGQPAPKLVIPR